MDMELQMDVDIRLFATLYVTVSLAIPYLGNAAWRRR
jgi:hypothetical protein